MGKSALNGWSMRHLLALSVALNVGLVLRLAFYGEIDGSGSSGAALTHFLAISVALNVGLVLTLAYNERDSGAWATVKPGGLCMPMSSEVRRGKGGGGNDLIRLAEKVTEVTAKSNGGGVVMGGNNGNGVVKEMDEDRIVNLDHGDPTMYEKYWKQASDRANVVISGWQSMSYFSDPKRLCWFMEPELEKQIARLHQIVGNAVTDRKHIVVGTGSSQLLQAALYALSSLSEETGPINVISPRPYYSCYKQIVTFLESGLYRWASDDDEHNKDEPYIEVVTSPNNPDGLIREPSINGSKGMLIHDFAYYWPQFTPITHPADHDLMLFTVSKSTGHAGSRIGWAYVKDEEVAKRMIKFIEISTIGVSKDSQLRAAKILQTVSDSCEQKAAGDNFFEVSYHLLGERWRQLREAVKQSGIFSLPEFPTAFCQYSKRSFKTQPAFAWLKCDDQVEDCEAFLKGRKILTRGGMHFGLSSKYARISMLDRDANYDLFVKRLSKHQAMKLKDV